MEAMAEGVGTDVSVHTTPTLSTSSMHLPVAVNATIIRW